MTSGLLNLSAIAFYIITWFLIFKSVREKTQNPEHAKQPNKIYLVTWLIALGLHFFSLIKPSSGASELSFGFFDFGLLCDVVY